MEKKITYESIKIGDQATESKVITEEDIIGFSNITGDKNPLHLDEDYAEKTRFGKRIAHGLLVASQISSVLANKLPGPGSVYLSQKLSFRRPVYIGDEITTIVKVLEKKDDKNHIKLETICLNQNEKEVIIGEALILFEE